MKGGKAKVGFITENISSQIQNHIQSKKKVNVPVKYRVKMEDYSRGGRGARMSMRDHTQ